MTRQWKKISFDAAKQHPLYGVRNWLAVFAFGVVLGPLRTHGEVSNAATAAGLTLPKLLAADLSAGGFVTGSLVFRVLLGALLLWLLFSKQRHFRISTIALLILQWPAYLAIVTITGGAKYPGFAGELTLEFLGSSLLIAIWVAYLQRSRRVRVTFEHCIVLEETGASAHGTDMLAQRASSPTATNAAYAEALSEIEEGRVDKGVWARSFAESGGDGGKAKANYIKARAESIAVAAVRVNTRPPIAQDAGIEVTGGGQPQPTTLRPSPVTKSFATSPIEIVVWVVLVLAIFGWWQYQEQAKRQEVAARPVQTGPDWDKGVITPPENASAQDLYLQKVRAIQERVKRGELSSVDGETSLEPPKNLAQWPSAESLKLENSQTWWRNGTKQFNVHVQNTTPYELTTLALDFGQQGCESAVAKRRFYVALRQVVTSGSQALLSFTPPFAVSDTPNNCLIVSSAWQPVKAIPAKAQAARLAATTNEESGKERAQNKQVQADLDAIAQRAVRDYPYLDTPAGQEVLDKIVKKRDEFIQQGQYPSVALTNAVNAFAPANAPRPSQEKKTLPVPESGDKGNHPGSDPKCRWVTPQEWSCK